MKIQTTGIAGSLESSDVLVTVHPPESGGVEIELESTVIKQFGKQIKAVTRATLAELEVEECLIELNDNGALDSTIRARIEAAVYRACHSTDYRWRREER